RRARAAGVGRQVIAHEDLLVFRPARNSVGSSKLKVLHREPKRPRRDGRPAGAPVGGHDEAA
ncbi:MAG: hypothetical protein M0T80_06070, partial [Actinomycetota bacterium]|nr:hypothetical protein [Actinomycetota bacterium]